MRGAAGGQEVSGERSREVINRPEPGRRPRVLMQIRLDSARGAARQLQTQETFSTWRWGRGWCLPRPHRSSSERKIENKSKIKRERRRCGSSSEALKNHLSAEIQQVHRKRGGAGGPLQPREDQSARSSGKTDTLRTTFTASSIRGQSKT